MKKQKILVSVIAILLAIVFLITFIASVFPVGATSLNSQLTKAQNERKAAEKELQAVQSQRKSVQDDKAKIDGEINALSGDINILLAQISETNQQLAIKERELIKAEEDCEKQFESFKTRARIMYENGPSTYIEIFFSSGSFSEFFSNIQVIKSLIEYDNKVLEERKVVREQIAIQKAEVEALKREQETRKQTLSEKRSTLQAKQQTQSALISQLESQEATIKKQIQNQIAEENRIQNLIAQAMKNQSSTTVSTLTASGTGSMQWPCPSTKYITSYFGVREHPVQGVNKQHNGLDIGAQYGADILAADSGTILFSGNSSSYGKYIVISHGSGITTLYAHCSQLLVSAGSTVKKGQVIAKVGSTGVSTGPHLHFEVSVNGKRVDPLGYVS